MLDTELPDVWKELDEAREEIPIAHQGVVNEWLAYADRFLPVIKPDDFRLWQGSIGHLKDNLSREI